MTSNPYGIIVILASNMTDIIIQKHFVSDRMTNRCDNLWLTHMSLWTNVKNSNFIKVVQFELIVCI